MTAASFCFERKRNRDTQNELLESVNDVSTVLLISEGPRLRSCDPEENLQT